MQCFAIIRTNNKILAQWKSSCPLLAIIIFCLWYGWDINLSRKNICRTQKHQRNTSSSDIIIPWPKIVTLLMAVAAYVKTHKNGNFKIQVWFVLLIVYCLLAALQTEKTQVGSARQFLFIPSYLWFLSLYYHVIPWTKYVLAKFVNIRLLHINALSIALLQITCWYKSCLITYKTNLGMQYNMGKVR